MEYFVLETCHIRYPLNDLLTCHSSRDLPPGKRSALVRDPWCLHDRSSLSCRWSPARDSVPRAAWMHRRCTHCIDYPHRWHCSQHWASPAQYVSQCSQLRRWPGQWVVPFFCIFCCTSAASCCFQVIDRSVELESENWANWSEILIDVNKNSPKTHAQTDTHTHSSRYGKKFCLVNGACACQSVYVSACTCMCECVCYYVWHLP